MSKYHNFAAFFMLVFYSGFTLANASAVQFGQVQVQVNHQTYSLEYAKSFKQRAQGLMFRKTLCETCGMLFKFDEPRPAGMWMRNTFIPLDVAFIRADGKITDIKPMFPHDLTNVGASESVLYAWEMNQEWFAKNKVKVGDTVAILSSD